MLFHHSTDVIIKPELKYSVGPAKVTFWAYHYHYFQIHQFRPHLGARWNGSFSMWTSCADPENFVRGGPALTGFFSWWGEGWSKYHYKWATIGPSAKCHLNGVLPVCWWWPNIECWLGSFVIFSGDPDKNGKETLYFCVQSPIPPSLWIHTWTCCIIVDILCNKNQRQAKVEIPIKCNWVSFKVNKIVRRWNENLQ